MKDHNKTKKENVKNDIHEDVKKHDDVEPDENSIQEDADSIDKAVDADKADNTDRLNDDSLTLGETSPIKKWLYIFISAFVFTALLDFVIEILSRKSLVGGINFVFNHPIIFIFNINIILFTLSICLLFRRRVFVFSIISLIWLILGVVNFVILNMRVTPFSAVDFSLIASAIGVASHYISIFSVFMFVLGVTLIVMLVIYLFKKCPRSERYGFKGYLRAVITIFMIGLCLIGMKNGSSVKNFSDSYTNISDAYENFGFVFCFADSIIDNGIEESDDYSKKKINSIIAAIPKKDNYSKEPNIIAIQLESVFDVSRLKGVKYSKDPMPNFHRLQKKYSSGLLTVPTVGAGTVNTEFEVLTGMNQHDFGVSEYPYKTILKKKAVESVCFNVSKLGYKTHGVHNNEGTFYGRNKVYPNLGFDTFQSVEYMHNVTFNENNWANDNCLTDEIIDSINSTEVPDFTFVVTVQSHGKYDVELNEEDKDVKIEEGVLEEDMMSYEYFVNQVYQVDKMIGELIEKLEKSNEDTVVVLYGDHFPTLGIHDDNLKTGSLFETDYVIWDNMGLTKKNETLKSYQLMSTVLDRVGIHEGLINKFQQYSNYDDPNYEDNLKLLEYDILYGNCYAYNENNSPYAPKEMRMGTYPVLFRDVKYKNGKYIVSGNNFSEYCKVFLDDKQLETTYVSKTKLVIKDEIPYNESKDEKYDPEKDEERPNMLSVRTVNNDGVELSSSEAIHVNDTKAADYIKMTED
ncbi:MAG: sulfatase-like hydrolase/transferase [Lachnospiraceae bacterium]|nr:sulfatase-like hydrolase/transferase [Lachnospiraceae bacterium]